MATWCRPRIDAAHPATCLRTPALAPSGGVTAASVAHVLDTRRALLQQAGIAIPGVESRVPPGRLLMFDFERAMFDGLQQHASRGYFDVDGVPPWDTWVAFKEQPGAPGFTEYLISWVPRVFEPLVDEAIAAQAIEELRWAPMERAELPAARLVRR